MQVGKRDKFDQYGKNDNFATFTNKLKAQGNDGGPYKMANLANMAKMTILLNLPTSKKRKAMMRAHTN